MDARDGKIVARPSDVNRKRPMQTLFLKLFRKAQ